MNQTEPQHHRKHITIFILLVVIAGGIFNFARPLPSASASAADITVRAGSPNLSWPATGQAAVGAAGYGVLATNGSQTPTPTASVAKIITALAILQKYPLSVGAQGPTITMTASDVAVYQNYVSEDGSVVQVTVGEQLTEYQILEAMLVPSANNIADSAAIWAFGSLANYVTYANQLVAQLGMTDTTVAGDASGFLPGTTSTASNLVVLGEAAIKNPVIAQIVAQKTANLPVVGEVANVDNIIGTAGIQGIKTGNNDQDTGCFLSAATKMLSNGQQLMVITAIMDEPSLAAALEDTIPLVHSTADSFMVNTPVQAGQVVGSYTMPWGVTVQAVAKKSVSVVTWAGTPVTTQAVFSKINSGKAGMTVGNFNTNADKTHFATPLVLQKTVAGPSFFWRLTRH